MMKRVITKQAAPLLALGAVMAIMGGSPATALTILVANGSFDAPGTIAGGLYQTGQTASLPGWTVNPQNGSQIDCVVPGNTAGNGTSQICGPYLAGNSQTYPKFTLWAAPGPSPDGGNYFLMDGDSNFRAPLTQTITGLTVGTVYQLTFYQAAGQEDCLADDGTNCDPPGNADLTMQWKVTFGSQTQNSTKFTIPPHTTTSWMSQTMDFTASSTSQVLKFLANGTPNGDPPLIFLDGVALQPIPEPGTFALIGIGALLLLFGRRWWGRHSACR